MNDALPFDPATDLDPRSPAECKESERYLLASCMQGDLGLSEASEVVSPGDFLNEDFGAIFDTMLDMLADGHESVIAADVLERMRMESRTNVRMQTVLASLRPSPIRWFAETADLEPTGVRAKHYANRVRDAALMRRLRHAANEILRDVSDPIASPVDTVANAERKLFEVGDALLGASRESVSNLQSLLSEELSRIDDRIASGGKLAGISTGYDGLDHHLGGLRPGQLIIVGGRPSAGKTALGLNIVVNIANRGEPVLFFSMEMPDQEISGRMLSMGSGVPMNVFTRGRGLSSHDAASLAQAASVGGLGGCPIYVDDTNDMNAMRMLQVCRRSVRRYGVTLAVVDYLQLLSPENPKDNRTQQVGLAARRMKQMARDCKIPVVCLCQLNREVEIRNHGKPRLSDLRESGEIEQHADAVVLLHVEPGQPVESETWRVDAIIAKNRNGPIGETPLVYRRPVMRFEEVRPEW